MEGLQKDGSKKSLKILLSLVLVAVTTLSAFFGLKIFSQLLFDGNKVELAKDFLITEEPKEIVNDKLVVEKEVQFVGLVLESDYEADVQQGIKTPFGGFITPEIRLVDEHGEVFELKFDSALSPASDGTEIAQYGFAGGYKKQPNGKRFEKIVLRSEVPIKIKRIIWSGYDSREMK